MVFWRCFSRVLIFVVRVLVMVLLVVLPLVVFAVLFYLLWRSICLHYFGVRDSVFLQWCFCATFSLWIGPVRLWDKWPCSGVFVVLAHSGFFEYWRSIGSGPVEAVLLFLRYVCWATLSLFLGIVVLYLLFPFFYYLCCVPVPFFLY